LLKFLWQHSSEKLPTGRVHDWEQQGICCAPLVEGKRLWFVTSRGEVVCCDTEGFYDNENDGPYVEEAFTSQDEADVIWKLDMMKELRVSQHNMCSCSVTSWGDILLVNTSNGVDESHINIPSPDAPSFMALDKNTGEVFWTDGSPGLNILHGQWSSPAVAQLGGVPQAIFAGGDGWLYSFRCDRGNNGKPELLWKFDCNPKASEWILGGRGTRNNVIATPVVYEGLVYVAVGQDPEHAEGEGHLWCIDPTKRGDVSSELAVNVNDRSTPIPHKRIQAIDETEGEIAISNPNSAVVWHYSKFDQNGDGQFDFEEEMHRSCGTVAIKDDLLYISDFSGLFHCLDAKTGKVHWTYDMFAQAWGSPLIVDGKVFVGDEDGEVSIFRLTPEKHDPVSVIDMGNSVYTTPIVANGVLFIANRSHLFAIASGVE
jgi:outer membrane protein assembly factor BamB